MEAKTPFDRAVTCVLAAGMGCIPIAGFINGFSREIEPGMDPLIKHIVIQEVLFVLSAFFVCTFLYYLVGDKSWLRPYAQKYAARAALVALGFNLLIMTGFIVYVF